MSDKNLVLSHRPQIDVLIPAIEKDLRTLPYVIDSVRRQVLHPIGQIYIVAPHRSKIIALCKKKNCKFIDEKAVLPFTKKDINYRSRRWDRSGWLFQQFLKLSGDKICASEHFLVIDADTVLIRPHAFTSGNKTIFYCRGWSQPEYFRTYRKLLGTKSVSRSSFVAHYMLFNKSKLAELKRTIESRHQEKWYSAIMKCMNKSREFAFSEFETYGNYVAEKNPNSVMKKRALNKSLSIYYGKISKKRLKTLAKKCRSLSFHQRKGYIRKAGVKR